MKQIHDNRKKSSVYIQIPKEVKQAAQKGLEMKKMGFKGGVETGIKRAKQLVGKNKIPIEDLRFMRNWFARHYYTSGPGYKKFTEKNKDLEDFKKDELKGAVAFLIWGGVPAYNWVYSAENTRLLEQHFNKKFSEKPGELEL